MGKKNDFLWATPSSDFTATTEIQQQVHNTSRTNVICLTVQIYLLNWEKYICVTGKNRFA